MYALKDLLDCYASYKDAARCIDIEMEGKEGMITVVGIYRPVEGRIECTTLIRGESLTKAGLKTAFDGCRMLITFNGTSSDLKKIAQQFPGVLPKVPHLDLYLLARKLKLDTNLKVLERTLGIERPEQVDKKISPVRLWRRFEKYEDRKALQQLVDYNRQDTINLYPLAEKLIARAKTTD